MGLVRKSSPLTVKQEPHDESFNSVAMRGSSLQWSFSKTSATTSQILSFKSAQDQEGSHKLYPPGFPQRNLSLDKQEGSRYPITAHRWLNKSDVLSASDARFFPATGHAKQMVPAAINSSVLPSHMAPNAPNVVTSAVGGISAMPIVSVPPPSCFVGSTDLKSSPNISSGPCQLTIFYNGSVCVYDNVSPEKAQAIMLLAGNGDSTNSSAPATTVPSLPKLQPPMLRLPVIDTAVPDQSKSLSGSISLPTPISSFSAVASTCAAEVKPVITHGHDFPKSDAPVGGSGAKLIPSVSAAVPQARKASLARFLEKRKERVTAVSPYALSKNTPESLAANSMSRPLPASN